MTLGERIKIERTKKGISQASLGEILKITQQAVGRWEKNLSEPDSRALIKMASLFEISIDDLLGYENITPEEHAAGASATRKEDITPLEDELLYQFRLLGKNHGEETQHAVVTMITKMN